MFPTALQERVVKRTIRRIVEKEFTTVKNIEHNAESCGSQLMAKNLAATVSINLISQFGLSKLVVCMKSSSSTESDYTSRQVTPAQLKGRSSVPTIRDFTTQSQPTLSSSQPRGAQCRGQCTEDTQSSSQNQPTAKPQVGDHAEEQMKKLTSLMQSTQSQVTNSLEASQSTSTTMLPSIHHSSQEQKSMSVSTPTHQEPTPKPCSKEEPKLNDKESTVSSSTSQGASVTSLPKSLLMQSTSLHRKPSE